jgi:sugar phosphate isomerase/epimerase
MPLRYAYNTNGCAHHRLPDALDLIAGAGYDGVALTVDWHHWDPFAPDADAQATQIDRMLRERGLAMMVETGARYLLDPLHKHEPTLVSPMPEGRQRRVSFLARCMDLCAQCGGECVSFWAGVPRDGVDADQAWEWLQEGIGRVLEEAQRRGVTVALEPEPGMRAETTRDWQRLHAAHPDLRLALDLGHPIATGEADPADLVRQHADHLGTVAIEQMQRGVHVHLPFGHPDGDLDVPGVLSALREVGYQRLVTVELSRESHRAHQAIPEAIAHLRNVESA